MSNKKYFQNSTEFQKFIIDNKPEEIWLDEFSETIPYLSNLKYFERNGQEMVRGEYTTQCFYVNSLNSIQNSYKDGMYLKIGN